MRRAPWPRAPNSSFESAARALPNPATWTDPATRPTHRTPRRTRLQTRRGRTLSGHPGAAAATRARKRRPARVRARVLCAASRNSHQTSSSRKPPSPMPQRMNQRKSGLMPAGVRPCGNVEPSSSLARKTCLAWSDRRASNASSKMRHGRFAQAQFGSAFSLKPSAELAVATSRECGREARAKIAALTPDIDEKSRGRPAVRHLVGRDGRPQDLVCWQAGGVRHLGIVEEVEHLRRRHIGATLAQRGALLFALDEWREVRFTRARRRALAHELHTLPHSPGSDEPPRALGHPPRQPRELAMTHGAERSRRRRS